VSLDSLMVYGTQNVSANPALGLNLSVSGGLLGGNLNANANAKIIGSLLLNVSSTNMVAFQASSNGSLAIVNSSGSLSSASGLSISPGSSATLTYSGKMNYDSGVIQSRLQSGSQYNVVVTGSGSASASSTVAAK